MNGPLLVIAPLTSPGFFLHWIILINTNNTDERTSIHFISVIIKTETDYIDQRIEGSMAYEYCIYIPLSATRYFIHELSTESSGLHCPNIMWSLGLPPFLPFTQSWNIQYVELTNHLHKYRERQSQNFVLLDIIICNFSKHN